MESIVQHGSPLAAYLEDSSANPTAISPLDEPSNTAASLTSRPLRILRSRLPDGLTLPQVPSLVDSLPTTMSSSLTHLRAAIRESEGAKFLEQFRYILATSPLLAVDGAPVAVPIEAPTWIDGVDGRPSSRGGEPADVLARRLSTNEVAAVPVVACLIAAAVKWARTAEGWSLGRLCVALALSIAVIAAGYVYIRVQWLEHVRRRAVDVAQRMVAAMTAFDEAGREALGIVHDVEEISDDGEDQRPRLQELRSALNAELAAVVPTLLQLTEDFKKLADHEQEVDKYLEVYEVHEQDISEARFGMQIRESWGLDDETDDERPGPPAVPSVRDLGTLWYRLVTLRRVLLCILLAMPCSGSSRTESARWGYVAQGIQSLTKLLTASAQTVRAALRSLDAAIPSRPSSIATPLRPISKTSSPTHPNFPLTPTNRLRLSATGFPSLSQPAAIPPLPTAPFRTLGPMTTSLRTALARVAVLKEDATALLQTHSASPSPSNLPPTSAPNTDQTAQSTLQAAQTLLSHFNDLHSDLQDLQSLHTAATQSLKDYIDRISPTTSIQRASSLRHPRRPSRVVSLGVPPPSYSSPAPSATSDTSPTGSGSQPAPSIGAPQSAMERNLRRRSTIPKRWSLGSDRGVPNLALDTGHSRARYRVSLSGATAVDSDLASSSDAQSRGSRCVSGLASPEGSVGGVIESGCEGEEGPREALRRLEGMVEARLASAVRGELEEEGGEEQVFEGVAAPPVKYMSYAGLSREERMRKAEDRRMKREAEEVERGVEREKRARERNLVVELEGVLGGRRRGAAGADHA